MILEVGGMASLTTRTRIRAAHIPFLAPLHRARSFKPYGPSVLQLNSLSTSRSLYEPNASTFEVTSSPPRRNQHSRKYSFRRFPSSFAQTKQWQGAVTNPFRLQVDDIDEDISPLLLRDICSCPRCVDSSTKQKLFSTTDIPAEIKIKSLSTNNDHVELTWENDIEGYDSTHTSTFPRSVLHNLRDIGSVARKPAIPRRTLWNAQQYTEECEDVDYDSYMNDDAVLFQVVHQLHTYGLAFVANVPGIEESVSKVAERIGPLKTTFYGRTWDVRSVPEAKNVAYTSQNLGFHMDLLYMEQPPRIQLLHCIRSSAVGGASLFTDSFKSARDLLTADLQAFTDLSRHRVGFHYDHPGSQYYQRARTVFETERVPIQGRMMYLSAALKKQSEELSSQDQQPEDYFDAVSWSPPFQAPFALEPGSHFDDADPENSKSNGLALKLQSWHKHAQKFSSLIHRPDMIYERLMRPGECVLFDNRRVLHARKAFEVGDAGTERWLRGAYIDKDPFMSKLKLLSDQFADLKIA